MLSQWIKHYICYIQKKEISVYHGNKKIKEISWCGSVDNFECKLNDVLSELDRGRGRYFDKLTLIFDSSVTHYMTTPWPTGISTPEELTQYINYSHYKISGGEFCVKKVVAHQAEYGKSCLSSLFDSQLFETAMLTIKKQRFFLIDYYSYIDFYFHLNNVNSIENGLWVHHHGDYASIVRKRDNLWESAFSLRFIHSQRDQRADQIINLFGMDDASNILTIPDAKTLFNKEKYDV